jgi:hypothetical protein
MLNNLFSLVDSSIRPGIFFRLRHRFVHIIVLYNMNIRRIETDNVYLCSLLYLTMTFFCVFRELFSFFELLTILAYSRIFKKIQNRINDFMSVGADE